MFDKLCNRIDAIPESKEYKIEILEVHMYFMKHFKDIMLAELKELATLERTKNNKRKASYKIEAIGFLNDALQGYTAKRDELKKWFR